MASLSVFDDQTGADESVRIAHDWVRENAATLIPNPPQATEGHVVVTDTACPEGHEYADDDMIFPRVATLRPMLVQPLNTNRHGHQTDV